MRRPRSGNGTTTALRKRYDDGAQERHDDRGERRRPRLLVQVIERGEFPPGLCLLEVIDDNFIACCIGTSYSKRFRICRIHLWLGFTEAGCGIGLFVKELTVTLR